MSSIHLTKPGLFTCQTCFTSINLDLTCARTDCAVVVLQTSQIGNQFNLTCSSNGKSNVYILTDPNSSQIQGLCSLLCN